MPTNALSVAARPPLRGMLGCRNLTELKQFRHIPGKSSGSMAPCIAYCYLRISRKGHATP